MKLFTPLKIKKCNPLNGLPILIFAISCDDCSKAVIIKSPAGAGLIMIN